MANFEEIDMRNWRKSIRDFNFDIGWNIWPCNRQLSEKEIRIGWSSWDCYSTNRQWACSVWRWLPESARRTKEDWVVRRTFLGLYVEWLPSAYFVHSRKDGPDNIVPLFSMFPSLIEKPWMLEDAEFAIAPEDSEFDIWVMTKDGGKHKFIAKDAIQLSQSGGKGPDRLRDWIIREWVFTKWFEKPEKWANPSKFSTAPDNRKTGSGDNGKGSKSAQIH